MTEIERAGAQEDHDCTDWNSGGACFICRRPLSIEEQLAPEAEVKKPKTMRERARALAQG